MIKINVHGSIFGSTGYDSHTRGLFNALYKQPELDIKLTTQLPQDWVKHVNDNEMAAITKPERKDDYNLIVAMPHAWKLFTGLEKNIGYCVWEGNKVPKSWIEDFLNPKINMIFVPSEHTKTAILNTLKEFTEWTKNDKYVELKNITIETILGKNIDDFIKVIPHGVDKNIFHSQQGLDKEKGSWKISPVKTSMNVDKPTDIFRFICNKGWRGTTWDRGGVQYILKAFAEEFSKNEKVKLILKLNPAYINSQHIAQAIQQLNLPEDRPQIHINCETVPFNKLIELYNQADCFVCATRAESFNLPGLEAMACGLPTIQTNYGGQIDYMTDKNSLSINHILNPSEELPMYEGINWTIPAIDHLRTQMRWAFENQEEIKKMGKQAEIDSNQWTWNKSAEKVVSVLNST